MTSIVPPTLPPITLHINLDKYHEIVEELATYLHPLINRDIFELYGFILKQFNLYELTIKRFKQIITTLSTCLYEQFTTPVFSSLKLFQRFLFAKLFNIWLPPTVTCGEKRKVICAVESSSKRVHFNKHKKYVFFLIYYLHYLMCVFLICLGPTWSITTLRNITTLA
jgi:hypothetical protein